VSEASVSLEMRLNVIGGIERGPESGGLLVAGLFEGLGLEERELRYPGSGSEGGAYRDVVVGRGVR